MYAFFMGVFRTLFLVLFFQFSLVVPAIAGTIDPVMDLSRQFALCFGRYSAEMEHQFLLGESADQSIARRDLFEDLLFAVGADVSDLGVNEARILSLRIEAKHAQKRLLHTATFNGNHRLARHAKARALREIRTCDMLALR